MLACLASLSGDSLAGSLDTAKPFGARLVSAVLEYYDSMAARPEFPKLIPEPLAAFYGHLFSAGLVPSTSQAELVDQSHIG